MKKSGSECDRTAKSDSRSIVKRGTIMTVMVPAAKKVNLYIVMGVFNQFYQKWFLTKDTPSWDPSASSSNYRISARQVKFDVSFSQYCHVEVGPENRKNIVYQLIGLHEITSIVEQVYN
jgi:hypothetical protein